MKWNEQKKHSIEWPLVRLSPIDWRRRILLVYFIYLACEHFFLLCFSPSLWFVVACQRRDDFRFQHVILCAYRDDSYVYTWYECCCCATSSVIIIIISSRGDGDLASTFDSCVWCILSACRQSIATAASGNRRKKLQKNFTANNKWLIITLTRLWPRRRRNQRIRNIRFFFCSVFN